MDTEPPINSAEETELKHQEVITSFRKSVASKRQATEQVLRDRLRLLTFQKQREKAWARKAKILTTMNQRIRRIDQYVDQLTVKQGPLALMITSHLCGVDVEDGYLADDEK